MRTAAWVAGLAVALSACTGAQPPRAPEGERAASEDARPTSGPTSPAAVSTASGTTGPGGPLPFDSRTAMGTVRRLAALGPREATSPAYARAASLVGAQLAALGYDVTRQRFRVPDGVSWGVGVGGGRTSNVVARPPGLDASRPHVVLGAHLDTVPQAPGAEDNASGVAVLLELARLAAAAPNGDRVVFVAFGAEEPRGPGDDQHHFGSQRYVRRSADAGRPPLLAMVSLDRVGAPGPVPVCTGGLSPRRVQRALLAAAERLGVPARACDNRTSDHWPFEKAGEVVARVGGNDSPGYHTAGDLPGTVSRRQLGRVGAVLWEWLRRGEA